MTGGATVGLAILTFAATNMDGAFLLVGFMADPSYRTRDVVLGQFLGGIGMTLVCVLLGNATMTTPAAGYLGLLGLLPVFIGVRKLWERSRHPEDDPWSLEHGLDGDRHGVCTVALSSIGSFGDNFGAYIPLFATTGVAGTGICLTVFVVMTGLWCFLARWLVTRPAVEQDLQAASHRLLPWMLIALGLTITGRSFL